MLGHPYGPGLGTARAAEIDCLGEKTWRDWEHHMEKLRKCYEKQ